MADESRTFLLKPGQIQAWAFDLEQASQTIQVWERLLTEEETSRSKRYRFERDRLRFIVRRGILRQLLGEYSGGEPAKIVFQTNPYGKLSLPSHPLRFNLSSCQEMAAYCFTLDIEVGIDLEQIHLLEDRERMVETWFSEDEQAGLHALAPEMQTEAFFHIWTQKEAFLKAHGEGLSMPLQDFSVSVDPEKPGELLSIKGGVEDISSWKMYTYAQTGEWRSAVCAWAKENLEVTWHKAGLAEFMPGITSMEKPLSA